MKSDLAPKSEKEGVVRRMRRRGCPFCSDEAQKVDYKDPNTLRYFITDRGKIIPSRITGNCARHQRRLTTAIKQARSVALLPFAAAM